MTFQVDLVAQGDSVYDIIDASDHLIARNNLSPSTSIDTGEWQGVYIHIIIVYLYMCVCLTCMYIYRQHMNFFDFECTISTPNHHFLHRSSLPLSFQHLQVRAEAECWKQAGSDPSPLPPASFQRHCHRLLLDLQPRVGVFLLPSGAPSQPLGSRWRQGPEFGDPPD